MKKIYFLCFLLATVYTDAQIINIPDSFLKAKLLSASQSTNVAKDINNNSIKIDTNNDGEIQVSEALTVYRLNVGETSMTNITGISYFTNVRVLSFFNSTQIASIDLTTFPNLEEIDTRYCYNLSNLNIAGLTTLKKLNCVDNILSNLNLTGLFNLEVLIASYNNFGTLNLSQVTNLKELYLGFCNMQNLNVSMLTNLIELDCRDNNLTSLDLTGLYNLKNVGCHNNYLTNLNLTGCYNLESLGCISNNLVSLDLSTMTHLTGLSCGDNPFITLDVSNCPNLGNINCYNAYALKYLFIKNGAIAAAGYPSIQMCNNLEYICADEGEIATYITLVNTTTSAICEVNSYCTVLPGGSYYTFQGNARFDLVNNGCDVSDSIVPNIYFQLTNTSSITFGFRGNESHNIPLSAGSYSIAPVLENQSYFTIIPASVSVNFPTDSSPFLQDFCITANGNHNDIEITMIPIGLAQPGFDVAYKLIYKNKGTTSQSGIVSLIFDDSISDFISAVPNTSTQTVNNLTWNFSNLLPFEKRIIDLVLNINSPLETPAINGGDILSYSSAILGALDETPNDNSFELRQSVVNSFDPNDKNCLEGNVVSPTMVGEYVHYMIRFENTGTADAQNIIVKDMIDTNKFDISSLIPLQGSHPFRTRIINTNQVEFIFENINLPFDNANNDGYFAFKIKTKPTLVVGDTFSNTANIYFDYNFPIVTNTATTTIQTLSNQDFDFIHFFSLSPLPAKSQLTITAKQSVEISSISIFNTLGQLVQVIANPNESIDVSSLKTGNYIIKIVTDRGTANSKFIKE